jgi:glycosyltransferase involved in cell wall biosynthesis
VRFCTTVTVSLLPQARVLAEAIGRHHPGAQLQALVLGASPGALSEAPFRTVTMDDLDISNAAELLLTHAPADLMRLVRPALIAFVRSRDSFDHVCYLAVDHDVLSPLDTPFHLGTPVALVRRADGALPEDTFAPSPSDLVREGVYTDDFLIVGPDARAGRFLDWYRERMWSLHPRMARSEPAPIREAARRHARQLLTLAPTLFALQPVDDAGVEASAWNLHSRPLDRDNGIVRAREHPLRTVHFAGFDPQKPYWLAENADRVRVVDDPVLTALCEDYATRLMRQGWQHVDHRGDLGRRLPVGLVFDARVLGLYEDAMNVAAVPGDPFTTSGCAALMAWMLGPAPAGAAAGINRYLYSVYLERPDLAQAYPDLDGTDGPGYASWTWVFGRPEMSIPDEFLPPRPADIVVDAVTAPPPPGVNVAGFFKSTLGLGEAARLYVQALAACGVSVTTTAVDIDRPPEEGRRLGQNYGSVEFADLAATGECAFNLICVNADELPRFATRAGEDFFAGRRSIGVWAWETDVIPTRWDAAYDHLDEIWVYSRYVAENLGRASPIPVVCVPPPVVAPDAGGASSGIELPPGYRFMFMFDFFSTQGRKNPVGVIEAFTKAFAPGEGPQLLIKTIHAEARPQAYDELRYASAGRPDVHVVDCALGTAEKNALMAECDCYVSLHRSEGYGLTLAECMALGKPVIGTGYSGNLDFMTPANSYLVDYAMTVVGAGVEIYPPEGRWAEPDLDHAAVLMREVYDDQRAASARGARARSDIEAALAPAVVGRIARERLDRLVALAGVPRRATAWAR